MDTAKQWMLEFKSGAMPEKGEVLIPYTLTQPNGTRYIPGDSISISFNAGDKSIEKIYKVAGTLMDYSLTDGYIMLHDESFIELLDEYKGIELLEDLYIKVKDNDYNGLTDDYFNKYYSREAVINMPGMTLSSVAPEMIFLFMILLSLVMLVGGVCLYTVISSYLKDSNQDYIILRLLGANNRQITYIILAQLLIIFIVSLPVGFSIGTLLFKIIIIQFELIRTNDSSGSREKRYY